MQVSTSNQATECATVVVTTAMSNVMLRLMNLQHHRIRVCYVWVDSDALKAENEERHQRHNMGKTVSDTHIDTTKDFKHATRRKRLIRETSYFTAKATTVLYVINITVFIAIIFKHLHSITHLREHAI